MHADRNMRRFREWYSLKVDLVIFMFIALYVNITVDKVVFDDLQTLYSIWNFIYYIS